MPDALSPSLLSLVAIAVTLVILIASSLKIAAESERFAAFTLGRYAGLRGPGLILTFGPATRLTRLRIGDIGQLKGDGVASFHGVDLPVPMPEAARVGDTVRIDRFGDDGLVLSKSDRRPATLCPKCGHSF